MMYSEPVPSSAIEPCTYCNLEPLPQTSQNIAIIVVEFILALFSFRLALILLLVSYSLSSIRWFCPMCKRQTAGTNSQMANHFILRLGNCMLVLSRNKVRVVAGILISLIVYSMVRDMFNPRPQPLQLTWKAIALGCGPQVFSENELMAESKLKQYRQSGPYQFEGTILDITEPHANQHYQLLYIKMDPTMQQADDAYDIIARVPVEQTHATLTVGHKIRMQGNWGDRIQAQLIFQVTSLEDRGIATKKPTLLNTRPPNFRKEESPTQIS